MTPYYQDDYATIYHGDCREILPQLPKVDCIITDPPYGVGLESKQHKWFRQEGSGYTQIDDTPEFVSSVVIPVIQEAISRHGRCVVTPGTRCAFLYPKPNELGSIFNASGTGSGPWGFMCSTPVLYYGNCPYMAKGLGRRPNGWLQPADDYAEKNGHPCPKPVGMFLWLVNRASLESETILDPFMGSGTTLVAAKQLGRRAIGIEIEEKYCEIAAKRLHNTITDMFTPIAPKTQILQPSMFA